MEDYQGLSDGDQIQGGGAFVLENNMGHEICNFAEHDGVVYGYVQPSSGKKIPGRGTINIDRLGAKKERYVENILIIWVANHPSGGTYVIGWYKNATVFREYQRFENIPPLHSDNGLDGYWFKSRSSDAMLLPIDMRTFEIPRANKGGAEGGIGQSNVWFADQPKSQGIVHRVLKLVNGKSTGRPPVSKRKTDPDHNAKVEKAAINATRRHYELIGYEVESVEKDNVGWDLEATIGRIHLRIEVKGLSGSTPTIQLSPNEFAAFSACSASYRLAIVTGAITTPKLTICRYNDDKKEWIVDDENILALSIEPKTSAIIKLF